MTDQHEPVPRDPPAPAGTPGAPRTGENSPPPAGPAEEKEHQDGSEHRSTAPAHAPDPHEPPD
ncbi:hypothetical protein ABZW03_17530 [Kitasatospora sp. NPDC004799]|uniref:hypothetical protein n=1 Tax=Kitasatospora sp. NPDC004799 TaxID=3154460 RepID=UPI0033A95384